VASDWGREHERLRQQIIERQQREAAPFEDLSDAAIKARRGLPFMEWCQAYLPHYFSAPFARFHHRMTEAAGEPGMPTFVSAFRGAGKSVLLALARPLYRALTGKVPYFIYGSRVQVLAAQNMDYVRLELEHNPRLLCDYGALSVDGPGEVWTVELPRVRDKGRWSRQSCKFEAFGIGMSPRGRRFGHYRPLEFVGDDLEDAELARNPQREKNLWDWMMDEVMPAMEPEAYVFTVLGTIFGPGCMMERAKELAAKTDATGRALGRRFMQAATDENGHSVWPERFSDAALGRVRAQIGLRNWNRNFALVAEDPDKPFQADWMGEYDPANLDVGSLLKVCFLDPALSESPKGCPRALVAVGAHRQTGDRYVLDAWIARGTPDSMLDKLYEFFERWQPYLMGIESNGGYALLRDLLNVQGSRRGGLPVRYVNQTENKDVRIMALQAPMEQGKWKFPKDAGPGVRALIEQLLNYPDGFVDGPDALASADAMLPGWFAPRGGGTPYRTLQKRTDFACV